MVARLSHTQAEIPWPVILVVRDSSFRWEELVLKGEEGLFLQRRVERGASVGPSKAPGQKLRLAHAATWDHDTDMNRRRRWGARMLGSDKCA